MDFPRLSALYRCWKKAPPVHVSVAAYVGWGKPQGGEVAADGEFDQLMASTPMKEFNPNG